MSARRWGVAVGAVVLLGIAAAGARWWAGEQAVAELRARGVRWTDQVEAFDHVRLEGVTAPGLTARAIHIALVPAPSVTVEAPVVDLRSLRAQADASTASPVVEGRSAAPGLVPPVAVEDLTVRWGDDPVVTGWRGSVLPRIRLRGPGGSVERTVDGTWSGSLEHRVDVGPLSGDATVTARCTAAACTLHVSVPEAVLDHPLLASEPLPPAPLQLDFEWDQGQVTGTARLGTVAVDISGSVQLEPTRTADLTFELPDTPLEDLVALFGDRVPEARRARIVGTVGATGTWDSTDGAWTLTPRADGLGVEGVLVDADGLRNGTVTWATVDDSGVPRMRRTGRAIPGFVPFQAAGLFPAAVLAAEDSGFSRHSGYDLVAVQAALDDAQLHGVAGMRGGSTITQQLAKNLFLETRERTLARKLRELLYALELDRVVPKERILELYINVVELGDDLYGVGAASSAYFLKQPGRLTVHEAAFLAALLPAPRSRGGRAWRGGRPPKGRMDVIIGNMRDLGRISASEAAEAMRAPLRLVPPP